ncbi:ABC transporter substrate-binding protein [Psychrobium sp. 1_MG-2023]|uniref:substrate-binding periplasmic protein n=1 Tax=Psychrobium sp. 1_MG-2023 TaxID=3062624 RepID=UPI000C34C446|nr:transporter substrate-binding domain-containing protein [Psychrobium sp. 1_MG-2023]MDP2560472.1 transporter substrate-binding domain-containing protein [Psychrobium sp. 1_MG-2023]PKF57868.1 hypothetical protein CW748_04950 [Alteromonadales bacterium alter-6D02]
MRPVIYFVILFFFVSTQSYSKEKLRVYVPYLCPLVCDEASEGKKGYVIDIINEVFIPFNIDVDFQFMSWQQALEQSHQGNNDAVIGIFKMQPQEESEWSQLGIKVNIYKKLIYPKQPIFYWNEACFYSLSSAQWQYRSDHDLKGKRLGTISGYSYTSLDTFLASHPQQDLRLSGSNTYARQFKRLLNQEIDILVANRVMADVVLKKMIAQKLVLDKQIAFKGCYPNSDSRAAFLSFSAANPRSKEYATLFDLALTQLRNTGKLANILAPYQLNDWKKLDK